MGEPRFIIQAKIPEGTTRDQFYQMLQNMLVERFGLKFHRDEKEVQGYQLVVAKNGPKFKESGPEAPKEATPSGGSRPGVIGPTPLGPDGFPVVPPGVSGSWMSFNRARDQWLRTSMQKFATQLDYHVGKPVVDATGLKGTYDLFLHWVPDQDLPDASGPTIFAALQDQLGLKLEPKKVVVPIVIVDHAEKVPTEN